MIGKKVSTAVTRRTALALAAAAGVAAMCPVSALARGSTLDGLSGRLAERGQAATKAMRALRQVRKERSDREHVLAQMDKCSAAALKERNGLYGLLLAERQADQEAFKALLAVSAVSASTFAECELQEAMLPLWAELHRKPVIQVRARYLPLIEKRRAELRTHAV